MWWSSKENIYYWNVFSPWHKTMQVTKLTWLAKTEYTRLHGFFKFLARVPVFLEVDLSRSVGPWESIWLTLLCLWPCRSSEHIPLLLISFYLLPNERDGGVTTLSLNIRQETTTDRVYRLLYRSGNSLWTGYAGHFCCTQFIGYQMTESFAD